MIIARVQGDNYSYKDAFILSHFDVEEIPSKDKDRVNP